MITNALLNILWVNLLIITSPIRILDDVELPAVITSSLNDVSGYISAIVQSGIVEPATWVVIFAIFLASIVFETGYITFKIANWIIRKIPTIS